MSKPVVLVDMDGVLVSFDGVIREWAFANRIPLPAPENQEEYFLTAYCSPEDALRMRTFVDSGSIFADAKPLPGAVAGLWALAEEADVHICTRPLLANPNCTGDKLRWVRRYLGPEFEKKVIITLDKALVKGAVLLDDAIKEEEAERADWVPVCFKQRYNLTDPYARWSWADPLEDLLQWT